MAAAAVSEANRRHLSAIAVCLPEGADTEAATAFAAQGSVLGGYRYADYLTQNVEEITCTNLCIVGASSDAGPLIERTVAAAKAVNFARDLVNGPPVKVTPTYMGECAQEIADENGLECTIFDKAALEEAGMNLLLAVSAGSEEEPRLIHLTYRPEGASEDTPEIALVGKGLTFDSGGYNLKPSGSIEDMKMDMAGGAAVLGAMKAITAYAPNVIVHGIVPSSENLVSGAAYKVGDIFHSLNGKSVQVMNTDAEGRLILADALCYTERLGVDRIVDLATLTGACMVALGPHTAGLFSDHDDFAKAIESAAERAGESFWRLPLQKKLKAMLKSPIADLKNVGQRWGGAITAGLFLQEFVGDTTWAHLDIAGPAYAEKASEHVPKGGTGFAVLTLLELVSGEF
jgi:leucyl aminopeptidase